MKEEKMKNTLLMLSLVAITTSFNACGGSSSSNSQEESTTNLETEVQFEKIYVEVNCTTPPNITEYIKVIKKDKIKEVTSDSSIKLYHDENNLKKVCLVSGEVFILRALEQ